MVDKLRYVLTHFSDSRVFISDGYYRVQQFDNDIYELEFSVSGYCGTFESKPAIKFQLSSDDDITFLLYRDMTATPIKFFTPDDSNKAAVRSEFEALVERFYQVKDNI
ncbi:hypothetical protein [Pseudolactococcus insecticola]|uniref:Uncharacterized protein n=1 Tax=Pseudolactococcus insecticola TaxID=2709158 RepID=A0A6A0B8Y3_9LACT|nr:hypothetical protein [Lactococcus insecticola]GFH40928.1 hypothetical protein Hs20B_13260 [Lactococcus insecticola]